MRRRDSLDLFLRRVLQVEAHRNQVGLREHVEERPQALEALLVRRVVAKGLVGTSERLEELAIAHAQALLEVIEQAILHVRRLAVLLERSLARDQTGANRGREHGVAVVERELDRVVVRVVERGDPILEVMATVVEPAELATQARLGLLL